ncbi:PadR family transcriptional regulator [Loigolactobacillus coryniformis]|jgi:PadR family transcriptional regulator PadR|uniref:Transcriptional regulator, PadR-like family n=4 Tax=Loigolactobacillus coryniformis TaxID=1610 RepID=J2ZU22_9LACO|nr:PadR family transcriptional regulator [Loigolactobacillus coryniformis]MDT3391006.1 PadR family transcriptional regulator [Bacillota bacterium]OEH89994.1 PadR family transcriptional regulator [Loigolactobacillus coryniformis subsp. coryniformis]RRG05381.1 MAG: PadR family transcriptional regulator [Lactobacillus sp.]ATO42819.1 PadR family transcriptional regulator [Loigolactobacillus coryniformis subsp. torquens DSM 20004 = KCTC 3535]ATO54539.1 PadR family transcriptional regulator [Loigola
MNIPVSSELLDGCVLALLADKDYYGYTITQQVQQTITISESTLYPVLRRLKKDGALETYDEPFKGRNRRYYRITPLGTQRLGEIRHDWEDYKHNIEWLLKKEGEI